MKDHTPYQEISRRIISTPTLQRLLNDVRVLTGDEKEDQLQDVILLTLQLMKRYPHFAEEDITGKPFEALLRIAYERDLIDRVERRCKTWVWEEQEENGKKRKKRKMRIEKVVWVEEFDPEDQYEDRNETDGRVTLPRVEDPEAVYVINHIVGKMKRVFVDRWAIVRELLANQGLADYVGGVVPSYMVRYANVDRIPAKVVCDAHGLTERKRKTFLGKLRDFLVAEGIAA